MRAPVDLRWKVSHDMLIDKAKKLPKGNRVETSGGEIYNVVGDNETILLPKIMTER